MASFLSLGFDYPVFQDSHGLINTDVAFKLNIEDNQQLMKMVVNDFEGMFKSGLIIQERCRLFKIRNHADFYEYLRGSWDTSYAEYRPGGERARREIEADEKAERAWNNVLSAIELHDEMLPLAKYDKDSGIIAIHQFFNELTQEQVVRDNSPRIRLLLPERVEFVNKYLKSH